MVQRDPVSTTHSPLHPRAFRVFVVPLLLARLPLRAPLFYQLLALSTTDVSIVIKRLALTTRLLRRLLGILLLLLLDELSSVGVVDSAVARLCKWSGWLPVPLARHWGTPPVLRASIPAEPFLRFRQ